MKIMLTGATGQVGWELARTLMPLGEVTIIDRSRADLAEAKSLQAIIREIKPGIIVNPAAYTAVDKAETDQSKAFAINADAPGVMAEEARKIGALFVHYSTDYVFDGTGTEPYTEQTAANPLNVYGRSKLNGERAIQAAGGDFVILRTSWVYASRGNNFLKTILRLAAEREELKIVADQVGTPTWARLIAETTAHVVRQTLGDRRAGRFKSDIYHLTSSGETSWHGFAEKILAIAREQEKFVLKNKELQPIPATEYPLPANRPANSRLSVRHLEQQFGLTMPAWDNALALCMQEL